LNSSTRNVSAGEFLRLKKGKVTMENTHNNAPIILAVVGHCDPLFLEEIKHSIETIPHFKVVFVKTSHGKLYIVGEQEEMK
jgi:hypothetical protein